MATAYVKCGEKQCGGEVSFRQAKDGVWICDEWSISVRFPADNMQPLVIESNGNGILLSRQL